MLSPDGKTAAEVSEMLLERTATSLLSNDFDLFARCFYVPHVIETPDRKTILKTTGALREVFGHVVQDYADRNVTKLLRICEMAEFRGPLKIVAMHVTHMFSGNLRVMDPFPTYGVLEFIDNRWQATSSQYAVDSKTTVGRALTRTMTDTDTPTHGPGVGTAGKKRLN